MSLNKWTRAGSAQYACGVRSDLWGCWLC